MITEVGGTVGDIEILPFLEAIRQFRNLGRARQRLLHPRHARAVHRAVGRAEDQADAALGDRAAVAGHPARRDRVPVRGGALRRLEDARSRTCATSTVDAVINAADAKNIYELPLIFHDEGLDDFVCNVLRIDGDVDLSSWQRVVDKVEAATDPVKIGLIGKYVELVRRLSVGRREPQARRLPPRCQGRDRVDPVRERRRAARRRPARPSRRHRHPRRLRPPWRRGQDRGRPLRPRRTRCRVWASASACRR